MRCRGPWIAPVLVLVFAVGAGAPQASAEEASLASLVEKLKGPSSTTQSQVYQTLMRRKDPKVIPLLVAAAPEFELNAQGYAVYIVNALPSKKTSIAGLRKLMDLGMPYLGLRAAKSLYDKGERGLEKTTIALMQAAKKQKRLSEFAVSALTLRKEPEVLAAQRAWLAEDPSDRVFSRLVYNFRYAEDRVHVIPLLVARLEHERAVIRGASGAYLLAYGDPEHKAAATKAVAGSIAAGTIPYSEFLYMDYCLELAGTLDLTILDAVAAQLPKTQGYHAARMLRLLHRAGYSGAVKLARERLKDKDKELSKAAFEILAGVPGGLDAEALKGLLEGDDPAKRLLAAESLRRADDRSGLPVLLDLVRNCPNSIVRRDTATALREFAGPEAVEALIGAMADKDPYVRNYAGSSLTYLLGRMFPYRRFRMDETGWSYAAPEATRKAGLAKVQAWWAANRDERW